MKCYPNTGPEDVRTNKFEGITDGPEAWWLKNMDRTNGLSNSRRQR